MSSFQSFFILSTLLLSFDVGASTHPSSLSSSIAARLQAGSMTQCWDSLMQLRSCSGEVILFFLNGEVYLGPSCCRAIGVIEHKCWAADAMLGVLGLTAEEGHVLRGYCEAATDEDGGSAIAPAGPEGVEGFGN